MIKGWIVLLIAIACGCQTHRAAVPDTELKNLTGVVIRKEWTKSMESWNAGGSEYYVLNGVILRPTRAVPFEQFANFDGLAVTCQGKFVAGKPYIPSKDSVEQMPSPSRNPFTGEIDYPIRGSGFEVHAIIPVAKK
jgi:hypothetical protein